MSEIIVAYPYERRGRELFRVDHCFKDHEGIPRRLKKRGFESRGAAITWGEKELSMIQNGIKKVVPGHKRGPRVSHTVESGLRAILKWMEDTARKKKSTLFVDEMALRKHVFSVVGEIPWEELTQQHCDGLTEAARNMNSPRHLYAMKTCLDVAEKAGIGKLPVVIETVKPKTKLKTDYLDSDEIELLCANTTPYWSAVIRFLFHTGLRIGEFVALEWRDIDLRKNAESVRVERNVYFTNKGPQVQTTKSDRIRVLPLNEAAVQAIREIAAIRFPKQKLEPQADAPLERRLVIADTNGDGYYNGKKLNYILQQGCRKAGLRHISVHQLRHSHASCMVNAGVSMPVVSALLGHSSLQVTSRYAHLSQDNLRAGVKVLQNQTVTIAVK
ncbi:site-specific integrase [Myxococcota bacterium]|nr:site-specific integrase [Myxococcota bacterium]